MAQTSAVRLLRVKLHQHRINNLSLYPTLLSPFLLLFMTLPEDLSKWAHN